MKKFLILMAFILSTIAVNAQIYTYRSYAYAQKNEGYSWSNFVKSDLLITINLRTDVIKIYNNLGSTFTNYDAKSYYDNDEEWVLECKCIDEEGLRCTVRLIQRNSGTSQIYVDYNNVHWCYNVRKIN